MNVLEAVQNIWPKAVWEGTDRRAKTTIGPVCFLVNCEVNERYRVGVFIDPFSEENLHCGFCIIEDLESTLNKAWETYMSWFNKLLEATLNARQTFGLSRHPGKSGGN